jgi:xylan 1,4-beta-xylosidase
MRLLIKSTQAENMSKLLLLIKSNLRVSFYKNKSRCLLNNTRGVISSIIISLSTYLFSCNAPSSSDSAVNEEIGQMEKGVAYFGNFSYEGKDDLYEQNSLPSTEYFYNPILPGFYSDPSVCTNGEDYFLVTSTFSYFPGVPKFHSKDLVNWKQIGHVLDRPSQLPLDDQRVSEGIFAPAISYNPNNETYYMITTNIRKGNFLVKTKDPFGAWSEPIWLPEVQGIDPSLFFDEDGKAYVVNNDEPIGASLYEGHRTIRVQEFDVANDRMVGPRKMIIDGGVDITEKPVWIEGPHLYKINGRYLLMCAEGGTSTNHREVIFSSDSPFGVFTPWDSNPILTQKHLDPSRPLPITCAGHADLIQKTNGEWWAVFLACRPINNDFENLGRETFLMPVNWSEDGFPYMTKGDEVIPRIVQMNGLKRDSISLFGNFESVDEFDAEKLGVQWMTLRGPAKDFYSLSEKPGFLSLKGANAGYEEKKELAFVGRRIQHHKFEAKTSMYFDPEDANNRAGIMLMKDETHQYFFSVGSNDIDGLFDFSLLRISQDSVEILAREPMSINKKSPIYLKVESDGLGFDFSYSMDSENWNNLAKGIDARYLSTANSFGFTGTTIGLYATKK